METDHERTLKPVRKFFCQRKWRPFAYQEQAWQAYFDGKSGLISVPTGYGKTLAATLGPITEAIEQPSPGLFLLYISPLRALTRDLSASLQEVIIELGGDFKIECRTGDTSQSMKTRQLRKAPPILFTTPESLCLLLSYPGATKMFAHLKAVVVDEWHELIASKRGVQVQLGLAKLRSWNPELRVWGMSATLGNLPEAAQALVGPARDFELIHAQLPKEIEMEAIRPEHLDSFPWAGHLGLRLLPKLVTKLSARKSTLIFTNTRFQAERWHQALLEHIPLFADKIAIHHSSLDRAEREAVEDGLRTGEIKWVVCTSSLDLGVDFQRVEQVVQIGSPKSMARLVQRAGRSQHRPGEPSSLLFVPTNSWELVELEAVCTALSEGVIEARRPLVKPMDVLVQHLVTLACGDGFDETLVHELRTTTAYQNLNDEEFRWAVHFVYRGGESLQAYPQYQKIFRDEENLYRIRNHWMARQHRMSIGTITSHSQLALFLGPRKRIGTIEESFISKLKRGDAFYFGGRKLEFILIRDMKAFVKLSKRSSDVTPSWAGTQLPISESLSTFFQRQIASDEHLYLKELFAAQAKISHRPQVDELLFELWASREGQHLFVYPFGGRSVHEGLAAVWAYRLAENVKATLQFSVNDYGLEILGPKDFPFRELFDPSFFSSDDLEAQLSSAINLTEMSLRQFRGIAQTAGLVFSGYPGSRKTGKQLQVSSSLLYEVFRKYDSKSLLFLQAKEEVLKSQLDIDRIRNTLERMTAQRPIWIIVKRPSPLAVPIWAERNAARLTNESLTERLEKLKQEWTQWT